MRNESGSFRRKSCFVFLIVTFAFLAPPSGAAPELTWSTYLGGSEAGSEYAQDDVQSVKVDYEGNIVVIGNTTSKDWISGGYDTTYHGEYDLFVAKLTPSGALLWSTYLGGRKWDAGGGLALDPIRCP
ncbi:MAG: SBBP repeat-containing protein [bacterium]|nr:SBBP repeat-containing protein [bacterium]